MTINHDIRRQVQRDARLWAEYTGTKYTSSLRAVGSSLAQGILGERITLGQLMQALDTYPTLGENGMNAPSPYRNGDGLIDGRDDLFLSVVLAAEVLQMFTPATEPTIGSYSLKHLAEKFLSPVKSYITNGQLIWAAAAIGLPMSRLEPDSPNVFIGISELEYTYAYSSVMAGGNRPKADTYQPPRWSHLRRALDQFSESGEIGNVGEDLMSLKREPGDLRFHNWLVSQAERDDPIGDLAADYKAGVEQSEHPVAREPEDLLEILDSANASDEATQAAQAAIEQWRLVASGGPRP